MFLFEMIAINKYKAISECLVTVVGDYANRPILDLLGVLPTTSRCRLLLLDYIVMVLWLVILLFDIIPTNTTNTM